jgi:dTDP-4-amino-4,6-dideoxygalactose transaminase
VFSFYPTKPVGSCDGGIIVSNNEAKINWLKEASMNGTTFTGESWTREVKFRGWKMYMNSIQAQIALNNLRRLDDKKRALKKVRDFYNHKLGLENRSDHLYRIEVEDNDAFIARMKERGIICGKHYEPLHLMKPYSVNRDLKPYKHWPLPKSEHVGKTTVSLPFHEKLSTEEVCTVLQAVKEES